MNKIIGMLPRFELTSSGVLKAFYRDTYVQLLNNFGFDVLFLSYSLPLLHSQLKQCDAFLIPGGDDVDPSLYHEELRPTTKCCQPIESLIEKEVIDYVVKNKKPLLGICKGLQTINVFFGGSLHQDIPNHSKTSHKVIFNDNSLAEVNSYHHQSIKSLAPCFIIAATCTDGTIESIFHESLPIIAVQWHPEMDNTNPINIKLLSSFKSLLG